MSQTTRADQFLTKDTDNLGKVSGESSSEAKSELSESENWGEMN